MPYNTKSKTHYYIRGALRKIFGWSSIKKLSRKRQEIVKGHYICEKCENVIAHKKTRLNEAQVDKLVYYCAENCKDIIYEKCHVDHIYPVIDPVAGFVSWDEYVKRLFCTEWRSPEEGVQILCKSCHNTKTQEENAIRRKVNGSKKSKKKSVRKSKKADSKKVRKKTKTK